MQGDELVRYEERTLQLRKAMREDTAALHRTLWSHKYPAQVVTAARLAYRVLDRCTEPVPLPWIEVRAKADNYRPDSIHEAPDTYDFQEALGLMTEKGDAVVSLDYRYSLRAI